MRYYGVDRVTGRDGEVLIDHQRRELPDGTMIEIFAVRAEDAPGGVSYSFQHVDPETGATLLRYDNAHDDPDLGEHHRHGSDLDPADIDRPVEFTNVYDHLRNFLDGIHGDQ